MNNTLNALLAHWRKAPLFAPEGAGGGAAGGEGGSSDGSQGGSGNGNGGGVGGEGGDTGAGGAGGNGGAQAGGPGGNPDATGGNDDGAGESGGSELPESYTFEFQNGYALSDAQRADYDAMFRELGLSQEAVDKMIAVEDKIAADIAQEASDALAKQAGEWEAAAKADKELGADWELTEMRAAAGMQALLAPGEGASPEAAAKAKAEADTFVRLMDRSGLGNHPVILKAFARVGQYLTNDKFDRGGASDDSVPTEKSWYGNTTPETKKG